MTEHRWKNGNTSFCCLIQMQKRDRWATLYVFQYRSTSTRDNTGSSWARLSLAVVHRQLLTQPESVCGTITWSIRNPWCVGLRFVWSPIWTKVKILWNAEQRSIRLLLALLRFKPEQNFWKSSNRCEITPAGICKRRFRREKSGAFFCSGIWNLVLALQPVFSIIRCNKYLWLDLEEVVVAQNAFPSAGSPGGS